MAGLLILFLVNANVSKAVTEPMMIVVGPNPGTTVVVGVLVALVATV